jgi:hypothetical protein
MVSILSGSRATGDTQQLSVSTWPEHLKFTIMQNISFSFSMMKSELMEIFASFMVT